MTSEFTAYFKMAGAFPWLAAQPPPPPLPVAYLAELNWFREACKIDDGFSTGTSRSISRHHERSTWGAFGRGLKDSDGRIGGPPRPQPMEGTRGCIGYILPTRSSSVLHRQAAVDLSGHDEQIGRDFKRKWDVWLTIPSISQMKVPH